MTARGGTVEAKGAPRTAPAADPGVKSEPDRLGIHPLVRRLAFLGYLGLVIAGAILVIKPSSLAWSGGFIAGHYAPGAPPYGDHLQTAYYLWLWAHSLGNFSHVPWTDPYQFAGLGHQLPQPFGWPLVLVSVPVDVLAGPVAAYNILVLLAFPACAAAMYGLARSLRLSPVAGAVAGFAYTFEPFRILQGTGHINALLAPLLPLLLLCAELALRRRGPQSKLAAWGAVGTFISIMASAELQLAVYAAFLLVGWVILRAPGVSPSHLRTLAWPVAVLVGGTAAIAAVDVIYVLGPSTTAGGHSASMAAAFAPGLRNLLSHNVPTQGERYIYPGVVIVALGVLGVAGALLRRGRRLLVCGLLAGLAVIAFLAIGPSLTRHPMIQHLSRALPPLGFIRVPGRIDIAAGVILAILAALGIQAIRPHLLRLAVAVVALVGILVELPAGFYGYNPIPPTLAAVPTQSVVLDLPPFGPQDGYNSTYGFEAVGHPLQILDGYSPFATPTIQADVFQLTGIAGVPVNSCLWSRFVARYSIGYVAVHVGFYDVTQDAWHTTGEALVTALEHTPGFIRVGVAEPGQVVTFKVERTSLICPIAPPNTAAQVRRTGLPVSVAGRQVGRNHRQ